MNENSIPTSEVLYRAADVEQRAALNAIRVYTGFSSVFSWTVIEVLRACAVIEAAKESADERVAVTVR